MNFYMTHIWFVRKSRSGLRSQFEKLLISQVGEPSIRIPERPFEGKDGHIFRVSNMTRAALCSEPSAGEVFEFQQGDECLNTAGDLTQLLFIFMLIWILCQ